MLFKESKFAEEYERLVIPLQWVGHVLDHCIQFFASVKDLGDLQLTITCVDRPDDKNSYHSRHRAFDMRTWNLPQELRGCLCRVIHEMAIVDERVQFEYELAVKDADGNVVKGEHIHVEYDDRSLWS